MRVAPLFETLDDLDHSESAMEQLLGNAWYAAHIKGEQECMIGYSDSGKDAGRMAAAWGLYKVQACPCGSCSPAAAGAPHAVHGCRLMPCMPWPYLLLSSSSLLESGVPCARGAHSCQEVSPDQFQRHTLQESHVSHIMIYDI